MKKAISLFMAAMMLVCVTSCGKKEVKLPEPAANVDPETMEWGWNEYTEEHLKNETSDIWYPSDTGKNDKNYIFFVNGHSIYKFENGEEKCSGWLTNENKHAVQDPNYLMEFDFDIVFIDNFTLYDYKTSTYYLRGNLEETNKLFEGKKFESKADDKGRAIEFKENGVAGFTYNGETEECKWEVIANKIVRLTFDSYEDEYYVFFDGDAVKCISQKDEEDNNAFYLVK